MIDKLAGLDLNLLVSLNAVLRERSVSKAAAQLGFSQPSMSLALRRLRIHFNDELLTRTGNTYSLTPLAVGLSENVATALDSVRKVFSTDSVFDPALATREFEIRSSDHAAATLGPALRAAADREAPGVFFRFRQASVNDPGGPEEPGEQLHMLDACDGMVMPPGAFPGLPSLQVLKDHWVCLLSADNSRVGDALTLEDLDTLPWVFTHQTRQAPRPAIVQLQMLGVQAHPDCMVDSFLALPWFLLGTDRIALVPAQLAKLLIVDPRLRWLPCPYEAVQMSMHLYWHPRHTHDAAHQWLRRLFKEIGRSTPAALETAPPATVPAAG
ncbi:LysR family transcriptional regulator [uncultured Amnibacterium sp.]|uniref:LysR family transcriptional regulator n=1 Tax=uncultured Amnibacterium sp. TaxID=1631851 RepID=UPI0035C96859